MRQARSLTPGRAARRGANVVIAVGAVAAASAVIEATLVPGLAIGVAALLGAQLLAKPSRKKRRGAERRLMPLACTTSISTSSPSALVASAVRSLRLKEAGLKTISFRVIVTTLDFGFNYVVLGDLTTSAGLSAFSLVAGPFFYFLHETSWTYLRPLLPVDWTKDKRQVRYVVFGLTFSHSVAKTITYRLFATASEFSTNLIVVQNVVTAAYLSSFGFFIGPFIYYAHERFWERLDDRSKGRSGSRVRALPPPALRPAAA